MNRIIKNFIGENMRHPKNVVFVVALIALLASCVTPPTQSGPSVDEIVAGTLAALTAQAGTNSTPSLGSISGTMGYPAEGVPPMRVAIFSLQTGEAVFFDSSLNQTTFQVDELPAGDYQVVAYTLGGTSYPAGVAGGFTNYIACGATENCTDHSLATVHVIGGEVASDIRIGDWFLPDGSYPPMPGPQPEDTGPPPLSLGGAISGNLSYPSSFIPPLAIVAFRVGGSPTDYYYVTTKQGDTTYTISGMTNGEYYVVAYLLDNPSFAAGYSQAVPCGLSVDCTDHSLIPVPVANGGATTNINPGDWYAPEGSFIPYPLP